MDTRQSGQLIAVGGIFQPFSKRVYVWKSQVQILSSELMASFSTLTSTTDTNELLNLVDFVVSSEGALYVILPYDYQAAARPLFEHTPVLNNNLSINAMMTLVTMISMMTKITKMTISDDNF